MQHFILQTTTLHVKSLILASALIAGLLGFLFADYTYFTLTFFIFHVFTLGVSHGALDRWLFNLSNPTKQISIPQFLIGYLLVMGIVTLLWILFPILALLLFLGYSAWHFGEAEWKEILTQSIISQVCFTLWGFSLFASLFLWNIQETNEVLNLFKENQSNIIPHSTINKWIASTIWLILTALALVLGGVKSSKTIIIQISNVILLLVVFATTNLAIGFALFFFYFHSALSFYFELKLVLNAKPISQKMLWLEIFIFSSVPCIGLIAFSLLGSELISKELIIALVVLGSAISFPHTLLFSKALNQNKV